jgi:integrase
MPIHELPDGRFRVNVSVGTGHDRQQRQELCANGTVARRRESEIRYELQRGLAARTRSTVGDYLDAWLIDRESELEYTTLTGYRRIVQNHVKPRLGQRKLAKVTPDQLQDYFNAKRKSGLSAKTLRQHRAVLHKAFRDAIKKRAIDWNPMDAVTVPKLDHSEMTVLNVDECRTLIAAVTGTRLEAPVLLALTLGLRRSECLGLHWADVDFESGSVRVVRTGYWRDGKLHVKAPKTHAGQRTIEDVAPLLLTALKREKLRQKPGKYVCPGWHPDTLSTAYGVVAKRCELGTTRFHDLRHTNATIMAEAGVNPKVIQERLGHANVNVTLGIYTHVLPRMRDKATQAIQGALG